VTLAFPSLPGLTYSIHKRPTWSTRIASHVSGREVRAPFYATPLYEFELTIEGLDSNSTYAGLGYQSLQTLMGMYNQCQGQFGTFLYTDPSDKTAVGQLIGTGNASQTVFTFQRTIGGSTEPVSWVSALNNVYLNGVLQPASGVYYFSAPNTLNMLQPPLGPPSGASLLAEDGSTGSHFTDQAVASQTSGTVLTFSVYVQAALRSAVGIVIYNGVTNVYCDVNLTTQVMTPHGSPSAYSISPVGGGWFQISITVAMAATAVPVFALYLENPAGTLSYTGTIGDGVYFSGANWAIGSGAAAFLPAFSVVSGATIGAAAIPLPGAVAITADFSYAFVCRFLDDQEDFEEFMNGLWQVQSLKFRSVKPQEIPVGGITIVSVTIAQLRNWASENGTPLYIYQIDEAMPSDIANAANIEWNHGTIMIQGDPLDTFVSTLLGFSLNYTLIGQYPGAL
jgi:hypothetical protein